MNLLVINFMMDERHGALGWQPRVVSELAAHCDHVLVITSQVGVYVAPDNVTVETVPIRPFGIPQRLGGKWAYNAEVIRLCRKYRIDAVFVHMAMEWSYLLQPAFRLLKVPVVVWYAHGTVTGALRRAVAAADRIVTSTPEGCRIDSDKVQVIGQGVDTDLFRIPSTRTLTDIVYFGRVSPRKRIELLIETAARLNERGKLKDPQMKIVGPLLTPDDILYDHKMHAMLYDVGVQNHVRMLGYVPMEFSPPFYETAFLHLNLSQTGSMDKTVMEALACGCPVLTSNEAFVDLLSDFPEFTVRDERPDAIAEQIEQIYSRREVYRPEDLRALVVGKHDLATYPQRVLNVIRPLAKQ